MTTASAAAGPPEGGRPLAPRFGHDTLLDYAVRGGRRVAARLGKSLTVMADRLHVYRHVVSPEGRRRLTEWAALRGRHRGRRAFVLANGPSLATQDLRPLAGEVTVAVNSFFRHPVNDLWNPTYYCFLDDVFFDGSAEMAALFGELTRRVTTSTFVVPMHFTGRIQANALLRSDRVLAPVLSGLFPADWAAPIDLAAVSPSPTNVAQVGLMVALHIGCSPIYLLGSDLDFLSRPACEEDHFYAAGKPLPLHSSTTHTSSVYAQYMKWMVQFWRDYEILKRAAAAAGAEVFNATRGGFLDVFPRVRLEDVVSAEKQLY